METVRAGQMLLTFDGQILELFGWLRRNVGIDNQANLRFHVALVEITAEDPDRKGVRRVNLRVPGGMPSCDVPIEDADWPAVSQLLAKVQAAQPA